MGSTDMIMESSPSILSSCNLLILTFHQVVYKIDSIILPILPHYNMYNLSYPKQALQTRPSLAKDKIKQA